MAAAVVIWAVSGLRNPTLVLLPVAVASLFLLQLVPMPESVLAHLAPLSAGAWKVALQDSPRTLGMISIAPAETRAGIARLLLGLATIAAVADFARRALDRRWLLYPVAVSAVLMLTLGVLFPVDIREKIVLGFVDLKGPFEFWRSPIPAPVETSGWAYIDWSQVGERRYSTDLGLVGDGFASFISTNSFAAAVYLTVPALLAVVLRVSRAKLPGALQYLPVVLVVAGSSWIVGVLAKSRAGAGGLLFAGIVFGFLTAKSRPTRRAIGLLAGLAAIFLLGFTLTFHGFFDGVVPLAPSSVQSKLSALQSDGRRLASNVAMRMFRASPVLGTGLGSYGDLNAQMSDGKHVWYFAHNDYAQLLGESGLLGLAVLIASGVVLACAGRRFFAVSSDAERMDIAAGWAALSGLAVQSAFDWNMHLPATGFLACLMAGVSISPMLAAAPPAPTAGNAQTRIRRWSSAGVLLAATAIAVATLWRAAAAETVAQELRFAIASMQLAEKDRNAVAAAPALIAAIARGERLMEADRSQAAVAVLLGQANLRLAAAQVDDAAGEAYRVRADHWFEQGRENRPFVRGISQPVSVTAPQK